MGFGVYVAAVVAGPGLRAVPIQEPGATMSLDDHHLQGLIDTFQSHPKAPEVYLDWLNHMVEGNDMAKAKVGSATPAAVALKAVRKIHSAVSKAKGGFLVEYRLVATAPDGNTRPFWGGPVDRDGKQVEFSVGWDECKAWVLPRRRGQAPIDLRRAGPFLCTRDGQQLTLTVKQRTYAETYLKDLDGLLRLCEIASTHRGFVLVGAA